MNRRLAASMMVYILGTVCDYLLTYKYVVVEGRFMEANPFLRDFIYVNPLWMWFLRDFLFLVLIVAAALGCRWLILHLSRNEPPARRARLTWIASKYWVIVMAVAVVRLLPGVHNVLLIVFGWGSPLSRLYVFFK